MSVFCEALLAMNMTLFGFCADDAPKEGINLPDNDRSAWELDVPAPVPAPLPPPPVAVPVIEKPKSEPVFPPVKIVVEPEPARKSFVEKLRVAPPKELDGDPAFRAAYIADFGKIRTASKNDAVFQDFEVVAGLAPSISPTPKLDTSGLHHLIDSNNGLDTKGAVYIAEGYATAASLHEATGRPVFVAFDAGNLKPVAENIRKAMPKADLIIAADNDVRLIDKGRTNIEADTMKAETKKTVQLHCYVSPEQKRVIEDMADRLGLTTSTLLRRSAMNIKLPRKKPPEIKGLLKVNGDLARLGNLLKLTMDNDKFIPPQGFNLEEIFANMRQTQTELKLKIKEI